VRVQSPLAGGSPSTKAAHRKNRKGLSAPRSTLLTPKVLARKRMRPVSVLDMKRGDFFFDGQRRSRLYRAF
jgi:hypothetical protein